jgi:hypothetical protein
MERTLHGVIHGKTIELDEDIGASDGEKVEVQVKVIPAANPTPPPMSEGLAKVYAILGERYDSGHHDTAERHNEHQP